MGLTEIYHHYNTELADERTNKWPLIGSPTSLILLSALYLYFVTGYGPRYMKDRKPYSFKTFIFGYNVAQIVTNALIVYHILDAGWYTDGFMHCTKLDYTYNRNPYKMAHIAWYLLIIKIIDYVETILYVFRKKERQVSFLHLYHHVSTVFLVWLIVKYYPNGYAMTVGMVNSAIHVLMYTYYLLSSFGPNMQKILAPVKPLVTLSQMIQFVGLIVYMMQSFIPGCPGTHLPACIMISNMATNFVLFYKFFRRTYTNKKVKKNED